MAKHIPRVYVQHPLTKDVGLNICEAQAHHLIKVLRLEQSDNIIVFNGLDGEWESVVSGVSKRNITVRPFALRQKQPESPAKLAIFVAGIRKTRFHWAVEKLAELGVTDIIPLITEFTQARHFSLEKLQTITIEAVEQCGSLTVPQIGETRPLAEFDPTEFECVIMPDEVSADPTQSDRERLITHIQNLPAEKARAALAVIIGPEGGFSPQERAYLATLPNVERVSLGPRILRTETAAIVAAAALQTLRL